MYIFFSFNNLINIKCFQDIWAEDTEKQKEEKRCLYNADDVGEERKWLLDLLLEESDADSGIFYIC